MTMTTSVKSTLAAGLAATLVSIASAQMVPPFADVPTAFSAPAYASNVGLYQTQLGDLYFDSDATVPSSIQAWNHGPVDLTTAFGANPFLASGGSVKAIFLGETAGWKNDFGFSPSSAPDTYTPLATNIENALDGTGNIQSGWETTVSYAAGQQVDFWLNSGGGIGEGGLFYAFDGNRFAGDDTSVHTRWQIRDVMTTYFNGSSVVTTAVPTLLVGFEDVRQGLSYYDGDFNDFVFGFQFLPTQPNTPVPEPSTYGLLGGAALVGLVALRRLKRKAA